MNQLVPREPSAFGDALPPGVQAERTALARRRTAVAVLGVGALLSRSVVPGSPTLALVALGVALTLTAAMLTSGDLRARHARGAMAAGRALPDGRALVIVPVVSTTLAAASLAVILLRGS